jgi:hypothetical protein
VLHIGASTWADQVHVQVAVKVHDDVNDNARPPLTSAGALSGASDSWIRVYVTVFSHLSQESFTHLDAPSTPLAALRDADPSFVARLATDADPTPILAKTPGTGD